MLLLKGMKSITGQWLDKQAMVVTKAQILLNTHKCRAKSWKGEANETNP